MNKRFVLLLLLILIINNLIFSQRIDLGTSIYYQTSFLTYSDTEFKIPGANFIYILNDKQIQNTDPFFFTSLSLFIDFGKINFGIESFSFFTKYTYSFSHTVDHNEFYQTIEFENETVRSAALYELSMGYTHLTSKPRSLYFEGGICNSKNWSPTRPELKDVLFKSDNFGYFIGLGLRSRNKYPIIKAKKSNTILKARLYKNNIEYEGLNSYSLILYWQARITLVDFQKSK